MLERDLLQIRRQLHISLNLGNPVPPDRQAELLAALAAELGLAQAIAGVRR